LNESEIVASSDARHLEGVEIGTGTVRQLPERKIWREKPPPYVTVGSALRETGPATPGEQGISVHQKLQEPKIDGFVFWDQ
jgi:hypothetical protein